MKDRAVDVLRRAILAEGGEWTTARAVKALHGFYQGHSPTPGRARVELNKLVDDGLLVKHGKIGRLWTLAERRQTEEEFDQIRDFIIDAAASGREPTANWRLALHDAALDLDRIAYGRDAHPDSVTWAHMAMSALSGVWLTDEEKDELYQGTLKEPGKAEA